MANNILLNTQTTDFSAPWNKEKIPLVLIHGLGAHLEMWFPQVPDFSRYFPVITVDLPGCGKSPDTGNPFTIEEMAENIHFTLNHHGIKRCYILGISLGGFVALEYAVRYSEEVNKVIFASTPYGFPEEMIPQLQEMVKSYQGLSTREIAESRINKAFGSLVSPEMKQYLIDHIAETKHSVYMRMASAPLFYPSKEKFAQIKQPALIITGKMDYLATVDDAETIKNVIPSSKMVVLNNTGHASSMENPDEFNRAVFDFLAEK